MTKGDYTATTLDGKEVRGHLSTGYTPSSAYRDKGLFIVFFDDDDNMDSVEVQPDSVVHEELEELEKMKATRDSDLYVECGDGNISVMTTEDNKLILSKQLGMGKIGAKNPLVNEHAIYYPSANDIVIKFKNIESLLVVKDAITDIEQALNPETKTDISKGDEK